MSHTHSLSRSKLFVFAIAIFALLITCTTSPKTAEAAEYASPLNHEPYVQLGDAPLVGYGDSTHDQFELIWQTLPGAGTSTDSFVVEYKKSIDSTWIDAGAISTINTNVESRINQYVTITGLLYNTDYDYRVKHMRNGSVLATYAATYHTRLAAGDTSNYTFVAYGDSASGNPPTNFISVQSRINTLNPAFSILLGDNAYTDGTHAEWDLRLKRSINSAAADYIKSKIDYFGWGNHDIVSNAGQPVLDNYDNPRPVLGTTSPVAAPVGETPEHNYSFDYGNTHFVTFDTNSYTSSARLAAQLTWAVADLNASNAKWKVVFVHFPIVSISFTSTGPTSNYYQQMVSQLKAAGVDVLFVGHAHVYERSYPLTGQSGSTVLFTDNNDNSYAKGAGLTEVVSGLGGRDFHTGNTSPSWLAFARTGNTATVATFGVTKIDVTNSALTISQVQASDGAIIDSFTINSGISGTNVESVSLSAGVTGSSTVSFTTSSAIPSNGKIVVTLPTSLGSGFVASSTATVVASSTGFDGTLSTSVSGNVITITRSGGTSSLAGIKTITLTNIKNPDITGSTGTYQIKTTDNSNTTIEEDTAVTADTITAGVMASTNIQPVSLVSGTTTSATVAFTTSNPLPANGKIVLTFPTALAGGFGFNSGGTSVVSGITGIDGTLSVSVASNVVTLTRSGGSSFTSGAIGFTLSNISNPPSSGSTGVYQIKTTNSSNVTIDQDASVSADTISAGAPVSWWNASWQKRIKITFNTSGITSNATSVPIMVALNSGRINYGSTLPAGADIRFVESDNSTVLSHEIEKWDTSGTSTIWVKVPQIDGATTTDFIYLYYNNTGASDAQDVPGVWSNNYAAVYHLAETTGAYKDSVSGYLSNSSDGQTVTSRTASLLGNAASFNGTNGNFITVPDSNTFNVTNNTIEAYVIPGGTGTAVQSGSTALTAVYPIVTKGMAEAETAAADIHFFLGLNSSSTVGSDFEDTANTSSNAQILGSSVLTNNATTPYYVASTVTAGTGGSHKVYVNGVVDGSTALPVSGLTAVTPNTQGTQKFGIGVALKTDNSVNGGFNGIIDEVRVSSSTRSTDWLALQNKSMRDTLDTFAAAEDVSGASSLSSTSVVPASLVTNASGNVVVSFATNTILPSDGKILVTFPTSLGSGFVFDSMGLTTVATTTGMDGTFSVSTSSNIITITRSGGTSASTGAKSITLTHIANPPIVGSTGVFAIQTKSAVNAALDQDLSVPAQTITAGALLGTNIEPASPVVSVAGNMTITFTTVSGIPANGKIVVTLPTSLGGGFVFNSGGSTAAVSNTIGGSLGVSIASNVVTITRSGGTVTTGGETESITLSNVQNPGSQGSTGAYQIKTTDSTGATIDQDTAVTADTISTSGVVTGWWDNSYLYRKKIVFNNSAQPANLVNFPVRVVLSTTTTSYGNFKSNGDDVRFVDADGTTVLNYEIENWNTASTSNMWVKVPQIDSASTTDFIYMYYGNSGASAVATTTGVWDSNYITVLHFASTTATSYVDSTSYGHNSDAINSVTRGFVTGSLGNAATFSGASGTSNITLPDSNDYDMTSHTNEAYIRKAGASAGTITTGTGGQTAIDPILTKGMAEAETTAADVQFFSGVTSTGFFGADFENSVLAGGTSQNAPITGTSTVTVGNWYHVADRFDDSAHIFRAYKNGAREVSSTTPASYHPSTGGTMKVGIAVGVKTTGTTAGGGFNGTIDEVRISNIARSEEWIAASSLSTSDTYNTYNSEESQGAGALTSTNVQPASLSASASGNVVVTFTTTNSVASDGKIAITLPVSLGTGFAFNNGGSTAVSTSTGFDGTLSASVVGNVVTLTRSGGSTATGGAKSITLTNIKNPNAPGGTGIYQIKTLTSANVTIDQDLAVTADTIVSASLSSTSVIPASMTASATGNTTIGFTTTNSIPVNGKVVVTFPTSLGSGFGIGSPTVISASGINGSFTVSTTSTTVTITRTGTGNVSPVGAKSIVISGITNPNTAGNTGTYQIKTTDSTNATIDQDTSVASSDIAGALSGNNVQPGSLIAGATSSVVVSFTTGTAIPANGKISVVFPTALGNGFAFDVGGLTAVSGQTGFDGTFSVSTSSNVITITRSGGTSASAGAKTLTLTNIKNPVIPGSSGTYSIVTKTSANVVLEQDTLISSDTITEGALTSANIQPVSLVRSVSGNVAVSFTTTNPIPVDGRIYIYMPISLGDGFILDDGGTTAITSLSGIDGTVSLSNINNFITIQRNGDGTVSAPGVVTFTLTHIKNPNITGSTEEYNIQTQTNSAITIDQDLLVGADIIVDPADVTAPIISGVASTTATSTATITWDTNENASSSIAYGLTTSYGTVASSSATLNHTVSLSALTPNTLYHFRVLARDPSANVSTSSDQTFTTSALPPSDVIPPVISVIASSTGVTTASIGWTTDESANSVVVYGPTTSYGSASTTASLVTNRTLSLTGLTADTLYHFRVASTDASGNTATSSDQTFTTLVAPDVIPPTLSSIASTTSITGATINWTTNEVSSSQVDYGLSSTYSASTTLDTNLVTLHSVTISGLAQDTTYHFRVRSTDASANLATSTDFTFKTSPDVTGPIISSIAVTSPSTSSAQVTWTTDENSTSAIAYGLTASYTEASSTAATSTGHTLVLSSLKSCTLYHYRVTSVDPYSNSTNSTDDTFVTSGCAGNTSIESVNTVSLSNSTGATATTTATTTGNIIVLTVPAGYSTSTAIFQIKKVEDTALLLGTGGVSGKTIVGEQAFDMQAYVNSSTTITSFNTYLTITMSYRDADMASIDEGSLLIYRYDGVSWTALTNCSTDTLLNTVTCDTNHFSTFGLFGTPIPTPTNTGGGSSSGGGGGYSSGGDVTIYYGTSTAQTAIYGNASTTNSANGSGSLQSVRYIFSRDLKYGNSGQDVKMLQRFLNNNGFFIAKTGVGAPGNETELFGRATEAALKQFQITYKSAVLTPAGLTLPNGIFGTNTRRVINTATFTWYPTITVNTKTNTQVVVSTNSSVTQLFKRDLLPGAVLPDVKMLQQFLNNRGFFVSVSGKGSLGNENESFGPATKAAVIKFQEANRAAILTPNGLTRGTGIVGESTRAFINSLLSH